LSKNTEGDRKDLMTRQEAGKEIRDEHEKKRQKNNERNQRRTRTELSSVSTAGIIVMQGRLFVKEKTFLCPLLSL
jgi:hypothetical protein